MSQTTESPMKKISLDKIVLNMGVGKSGDAIEIAKRALDQITGKKSVHAMQKRHKGIGELEKENQ